MSTAPSPVTSKKVTKKSTEKHSVQVVFSTPEDIQLFNYLKQMAEADRRSLQLFVLLQLHNAIALPTETEGAE